MFIDLHLHESAYSPDSQMTLDELVQAAREKGLGAVCITDHDSMGLAEYAKEYSREHQYPVLVGAEFFSLWGDITAFGIDAIPDHRGLAEHLKDVHGLGGVEVLNGSTDLEANRMALKYCRELGLQPIGASDAHWTSQVGKFVTWFPDPVYSMEDLVFQLKSGRCKPAVWEENGYRIVDDF